MRFPSYCIEVLIVYWIIGLFTFLAESFRHFDVDGEEVEVTVHQLSDATSRKRRSTDGFPEVIDVNFSAKGFNVSFVLQRNYDVTDDVPVLLKRSEIVKYRFDSNERAAYYIDVNTGASMMAWQKREPTDFPDLYDLFGTFKSGKDEFLIQPPDGDRKNHTVAKITEETPVISDYKLNPDFDMEALRRNYQQQNSTSERRRRADINYEIEIFFVIDYKIYQTWYATTTQVTDRVATTINYIKQFYAFVLNAINMRYKTVTGSGYTITCLYAGIYIADTTAAAPFVEQNVRNVGTGVGIFSEDVLQSFTTWAEANLARSYGYDHGMMFTGYEMGSSVNGQFNSATAGYAHTPGLCTNTKYSINEDKFKATIATVASHELAHNLGALHDQSSENACSEYDGFIMAPVAGVTNNTANNLRLWVFSSCSKEYINIYINTLRNNNCMLTRQSTNTAGLDAYSRDLAGQVYTPDMQCARDQGAGSYLFRGFYDANYSNICTLMACSDQENTGSYYYSIAWEGTSCGSGKICRSGSCVASVSAPVISNEACMFGDVPYKVPFESSTCQELLGSATTSFNCYNDFYRKSCCATCEQHRQNNLGKTDCTYGDKAAWCATLSLVNCYANEAVCCQSCPARALAIVGCKYGDRVINCNKNSCTFYQASDLQLCCQTCAPATTTTTTRTMTTSSSATSTLTTTPTTTSTTTPSTTSTKTTPTTTTTTTTTSTTTTPTTTTTRNPTTTSTTTTKPTTTSTTITAPPTTTTRPTTSTTATPTTSSSTSSATPTTTSTTTTTTTSTSKSTTSTTTTSLIAVFPVQNNDTDLNDSTVKEDIKEELTSYYGRFLGDKLKGVTLNSVRRGSAIVNYTVEYKNEEDAASALSKATTNLLSGAGKITILNEIVSATRIEVNNKLVLTNGTDVTLCSVFLETYGQCVKDNKCEVIEGNPTCVQQSITYGLTFIIAIVLGVVGFFLIILIVICCSRCVCRARKVRKHRPESFPATTVNEADGYWSHSKNTGGRSLAEDYNYSYYIGDIPANNHSRRHTSHGHHKKRTHDNRFRSSVDSKRNTKTHITRHSSGDNRYSSDSSRQNGHSYAYDNRAMDSQQIPSSSYQPASRNQQIEENAFYFR